MKDITKEIYKRALRLKGETSQIDISIEEAAEFIQSLTKVKRHYESNVSRIDLINKVAEEASDLFVMIEQMLITFNIEKQFEESYKNKIKRLIERLDKLEGGK